MKILDRKGQGATEYLLMLAAVLVIVAAAIYYVTSTGGYPAVSATATTSDNDLTISVETGSIAAGDWEVTIKDNTGSTVSADSGYNNSKLEAPSVTIKTNATGSSYYEITLKHTPSGHIYFSDQKVSV